MHYQISEADFNCLESVRDQLALISGLLSVADDGLNFINANSLYSFIKARTQDISKVLEDAESRLRDLNNSVQKEHVTSPSKSLKMAEKIDHMII